MYSFLFVNVYKEQIYTLIHYDWINFIPSRYYFQKSNFEIKLVRMASSNQPDFPEFLLPKGKGKSAVIATNQFKLTLDLTDQQDSICMFNEEFINKLKEIVPVDNMGNFKKLTADDRMFFFIGSTNGGNILDFAMLLHPGNALRKKLALKSLHITNSSDTLRKDILLDKYKHHPRNLNLLNDSAGISAKYLYLQVYATMQGIEPQKVLETLKKVKRGAYRCECQIEGTNFGTCNSASFRCKCRSHDKLCSDSCGCKAGQCDNRERHVNP